MYVVSSADGTAIGCERRGAGPTVVVVDPAGAYQGFRPLGGVVDLLARDFCVLTYDRRGRGASGDSDRYAVEREIEDLAAVLGAGGFVYGFSSGAALALHAAAAGLPIERMLLLEPAVDLAADTAPDTLGAEVAALVAAGRRGAAVVHFNRAIGVPDEMIDGLRALPQWPDIEALAHTFTYDVAVADSMSAAIVARVDVPTLVVDSAGSDERLRGWSRAVARLLPAGTHRELPGGWHGVAEADLAVAARDFFLDAR